MGRKLAKRICRVLDDMQSALDSEDPDDKWKALAISIGCTVTVVGIFAVSYLSVSWYSDGISMTELIFRVIGGEVAVIAVGILVGTGMWHRGKRKE